MKRVGKPKRLIAFEADFQDSAIVTDHRIISNIGPAVADELALRMVESLIGEESVRLILENMMYTKVSSEDLKWTQPHQQSEVAASAGPCLIPSKSETPCCG